MIVSKIFDIFCLLADWFNVENLRSNAIVLIKLLAQIGKYHKKYVYIFQYLTCTSQVMRGQKGLILVCDFVLN